ADVAERFLRKGRKVYLEGSLQTRKWTDQGGQERYTTEVVMAAYRGELVLLDNKDAGDAPRQQQGRNQNNQQSGGWDSPQGNPDLDDEIPF
ncbi:single-stranded DNA-binding protein, partial [Acetobacter pasteurianus]